ncbi:MAG: hypothetical protein JWP37_3135 [Mucilaginibacter sp.]|nr:hypothetical protein [Mucilaginibacter sp.]
MNTNKTTSTSKLVKRFDNELKLLLISDLKNIKRVKKQFINTLSVA